MLEHRHLNYVTLCVGLIVGWLTLFMISYVFLLEAFMFQTNITAICKFFIQLTFAIKHSWNKDVSYTGYLYKF